MRASHPTTSEETAQKSTFWLLLSQVLVCVEERARCQKSREMLIQHNPAEPAQRRQQRRDRHTDMGKLLGSPAGHILGRLWAAVTGAI